MTKKEAQPTMFQLREKLRGFLFLRSTHRCLENFSRPGKAGSGRLGIFRALEMLDPVRTKILETLVGQRKSGQKSTKSDRTEIAKIGFFGI